MGHRSIAEAIGEAFDKAGWQVKIHHSPLFEFSLYQAINFFIPQFSRLGYGSKNKEKIHTTAFQIVGLRKSKEVKEALLSFNPDLVINTCQIFSTGIEAQKKRSRFIFFNIIANPRGSHPSEFSKKADFNLVYDQKAVKHASKLGFKNTEAVGWLTRKKFYQSYIPKAENKNLKILVCGGSWGNKKIIRVLSVFPKIRANINLYLVAGENKTLFKAFKLFKTLVNEDLIKTEGKLRIKNYQFVNNLNRLIAKSDLVIGKAGPNLIFDTVAVGKPFIAITHSGGHETKNLEIIKEKKLGWVAEKPKGLEKLLNKIVRNKSLLKKLSVPIRKERERNISTAEKIVKLADNFLPD